MIIINCLRMNFTPKSAGTLSQNWQIKFIMKFLAFLNLIFIRSYTKFHKNKTIISSWKNKQGSIMIYFFPYATLLIFSTRSHAFIFLKFGINDLIKIKLRNAENFNKITNYQFWDGQTVKFPVNTIFLPITIKYNIYSYHYKIQYFSLSL
jgi:hypothetical protein